MKKMNMSIRVYRIRFPSYRRVPTTEKSEDFMWKEMVKANLSEK